MEPSRYAVRGLPAGERRVLCFLRQHGSFVTGVKETGDRDLEYVDDLQSRSSLGLDRGMGLDMTEDEIITCLHALESRGVITSSHAVHAYDSSQYLYTWRIRE